MNESLSTKYRPRDLSDMIGQDAVVGPSGRLTRMLALHRLASCIFYGPPGTGKTTAAMALAEKSNLKFFALNATNASLKDIRDIVPDDAENGPVLLYLDEIQYFNKKQQQSLLPYIESGQIILIAATTDNPYYQIYDALLSRCSVIEFKPVDTKAITENVIRVTTQEGRSISEQAADIIAQNASGDVRRSLNLLEQTFLMHNPSETITEEMVKAVLPTMRMAGFDTDGDYHYSLISGLQKSIRGSDPSAAVFYLARLLEGGNILSPCRRILVIANEDIGLADTQAVSFAYDCVQMAKELGLPEANKPLTNAVIRLALSAKSDTAENAYGRAMQDIQNGYGKVIPVYLRHAHTTGYIYPHDYKDHWVPQQYLPDDIKDRQYYLPNDNMMEQQLAEYWRRIKNNWKNEKRTYPGG